MEWKLVWKLARYGVLAAARSRWIAGYALFFFLITEALMRFGGDSGKTAASLLNIVLLIIPLVSVVVGAMTAYNNRDFTELLLSQPIERRSLFAGQFLGFASPLCAAYLGGVGVPLLARANAENIAVSLTLLAVGTFLTLIFIALAVLVSTRFDDRALGLGAALLLWLAFALVYDVCLMAAIWAFREYPLEMPVLAASMLNPIDLARVMAMLRFDAAALMGYTGAVFQKFFGTTFGIGAILLALCFWLAAPFALGMRAFERKDF